MYSPVDIDIQSISDVSVYPKMSANDVLVAPVVAISSRTKLFSRDTPFIIELMKTAQVLDHGSKQIVAMVSHTDRSLPPHWKVFSEACDEVEDRFSIKASHLGYFTVIARFSPPSASVIVDPINLDTVELTVPELPGFVVTIPSKSVNSATEVKATLYYDPKVSQVNYGQHLATACVQLEPHGQHFRKKVSVQMPIPGYSTIIEQNPSAKLQLLCSPSGCSNDWVIYDDIEIASVKEDVVATFLVSHFSWWKLVWPEGVTGVAKAIGKIFHHVKYVNGRCQSFMTREADLGSAINFSIQVLVYPFQHPPQGVPTNYHYILHDSGCNPIKFNSGRLHISMKPKDYLLCKNDSKELTEFLQLSENFAAVAEFDVDLDIGAKKALTEGAVLARLSMVDITAKEHHCNLIMVKIPVNYVLTHVPTFLSAHSHADEKRTLNCLQWPISCLLFLFLHVSSAFVLHCIHGSIAVMLYIMCSNIYSCARHKIIECNNEVSLECTI